MLKTAALAGLLATSFAANAAGTWNFSYTGFLNESTGLFDADYRMAGSFAGDDANGDGYLEMTEITSFLLNDVNYISCASDSNAYYKCGADNFRYEIGGKLEFMAGTHGSDPEGMVGGVHYFEAGNREYIHSYRFDDYSTTAYLWTDQTAFNIAGVTSGSPLPAIPEPGTWAMLAADLLVISGAYGRRRASAARASKFQRAAPGA